MGKDAGCAIQWILAFKVSASTVLQESPVKQTAQVSSFLHRVLVCLQAGIQRVMWTEFSAIRQALLVFLYSRASKKNLIRGYKVSPGTFPKGIGEGEAEWGDGGDRSGQNRVWRGKTGQGEGGDSQNSLWRAGPLGFPMQSPGLFTCTALAARYSTGMLRYLLQQACFLLDALRSVMYVFLVRCAWLVAAATAATPVSCVASESK